MKLGIAKLFDVCVKFGMQTPRYGLSSMNPLEVFDMMCRVYQSQNPDSKFPENREDFILYWYDHRQEVPFFFPGNLRRMVLSLRNSESGLRKSP